MLVSLHKNATTTPAVRAAPPAYPPGPFALANTDDPLHPRQSRSRPTNRAMGTSMGSTCRQWPMRRRTLPLAIDRATRSRVPGHEPPKTAAAAQSFLHALHKEAPFRIHILLADNGKEFTRRAFHKGGRRQHAFDALCEALGIEHRLTKPKSPKTNGMVERFNGRLEQVLRSHPFSSAMDLEATLKR